MDVTSISYELSKFNPKPNSELLCAICFCVLHDPRMCPCHHIFCGTCIRRWLLSSATCPTCRSPVRLVDLGMAPPLVQNVLSSLTMDCDFKDEGCDQIIVKENFPSHITSCGFRSVTCPHMPCSMEMKALDLEAHLEKCRYRKVQCTKYCHLLLPIHQLGSHDCLTAMSNRIEELETMVNRQFLVMRWLREKLNMVPSQDEPQALQLQFFHENRADINQYWPEDQPYPILFCGSYMPSSRTVTSQTSSVRVTGENDNVAGSSTTTVEQLLPAGQSRENRSAVGQSRENRSSVLDVRDPIVADGPVAHIEMDTPQTSERANIDIYLYSLMASDFSNDGWTSSCTDWYPSETEDDENSSASHQYQSPGHSAASDSDRAGRRHDEDVQEQDRDYTEATHSREQSGSDFDEDQSFETTDSSGSYSSYSQQDYSTPSRSSAAYSYHCRSSSNAHTSYSRHGQNDDPGNTSWSYSGLRTYNRSHLDSPEDARSRYRSTRRLVDEDRQERNDRSGNYIQAERYSQSRSRSGRYSPPSRSGRYSPPSRSGRYSPPSRSGRYSPPSRSGRYSPPGHDRSQSRSSEDSRRRYSASSSDRSRSRSHSTSRDRNSRISSPHPARRLSQSVSSSQSSSTSSHTQTKQLEDSDQWEKTNDLNSSSEEWQSDGGAENDPPFGLEETGGEVLDEYDKSQDNNTGIDHGSCKAEEEPVRWYKNDSINCDFQDEPVYRALSIHSSSSSSAFRNSFEGNRERKSSSNLSDNDEPNNKPNYSSEEISNQIDAEKNSEIHDHLSVSPVERNSRTVNSPAEKPSTSGSTGEEEDHFAKKETLAQQYSLPASSSNRVENNAIDPEKKSETEDSVGASDEPDDRINKRKVHHEPSHSIWESSSDTTSLDYDIPEEDSTPKPETSAEESSPNTSVEHTDINSNGVGDAHCEAPLCHGENSDGDKKINRNQSTLTDSEEDIPLPNLPHRQRIREAAHTGSEEDLPLLSLPRCQRMGQTTSSRGKGNALKLKRKRQPSTTEPDRDSNNSGVHSDSDVCFKRRMKAKALDSSSDSEASVRQSETQTSLDDGDEAQKTGDKSNLPSTSHSSLDVVNKKQSKGKQKRGKRSDRKNMKTATCKPKVKSELKCESKLRKSQKSHSSPKKPRLDSSSSHRDNSVALQNSSTGSTSISSNMEHQSVRQANIPASNSNIQVNSQPLSSAQELASGHGNESAAKTGCIAQHQMSSQELASGHGNESAAKTGCAAQHQKRSLRSHTVSRQDLSERTNNGMENASTTSGITSSMERRFHHRHVEAERRRGNERRVIEMDSARRVESRPSIQGMSAFHLEREGAHPCGRRIMQIDNPRNTRDVIRVRERAEQLRLLNCTIPKPGYR